MSAQESRAAAGGKPDTGRYESTGRIVEQNRKRQAVHATWFVYRKVRFYFHALQNVRRKRSTAVLSKKNDIAACLEH